LTLTAYLAGFPPKARAAQHPLERDRCSAPLGRIDPTYQSRMIEITEPQKCCKWVHRHGDDQCTNGDDSVNPGITWRRGLEKSRARRPCEARDLDEGVGVCTHLLNATIRRSISGLRSTFGCLRRTGPWGGPGRNCSKYPCADAALLEGYCRGAFQCTEAPDARAERCFQTLLAR
jgi:hypothetical protein